MNRAVVLPDYRDDRQGLHYWPGELKVAKRGETPMSTALVQLHLPSMPAEWRFPVITMVAMIALAALDFAGALFAREWSEHGHVVLLAGGLLTFSALFVVYARILAVAELSIVTLGWIVFLQVGMIAMDRFYYGMTLPWQKWAAILLILLLQTYLLTGSHRQRVSPVPASGNQHNASLHQLGHTIGR